MTTPTPGDLSARHVEALRELRDSGDVSDWRSMESALDAAIAALSALPAAGGAVGEVRWSTRNCADRFLHTFVHDVPLPDGTKLYTTPQPSAAEDYESWAKQERQREDTATRLGSAAVGAQGDECFCDAQGIGAPGVSCGDCPRDYAAPAAGKGVDALPAKWRRDADNASSETAYAALAPMHEALRAEATARRRCADELEAALTRQPAPSDDDLPGMWSHSDFTGGDPDERSHHERTRQPVAGDGPTRTILSCQCYTSEQRRLCLYKDGCVLIEAHAAPAATPTDGGEG